MVHIFNFCFFPAGAAPTDAWFGITNKQGYPSTTPLSRAQHGEVSSRAANERSRSLNFHNHGESLRISYAKWELTHIGIRKYHNVTRPTSIEGPPPWLWKLRGPPFRALVSSLNTRLELLSLSLDSHSHTHRLRQNKNRKNQIYLGDGVSAVC